MRRASGANRHASAVSSRLVIDNGNEDPDWNPKLNLGLNFKRGLRRLGHDARCRGVPVRLEVELEVERSVVFLAFFAFFATRLGIKNNV